MMRWSRNRALWAVVLLFGTDLSGQSSRASTFHVSGAAVTLSGHALSNEWVTFEGVENRSVKTDSARRYETDLPAGVWRAAVTISSTSRIDRNTSLTPPRLFRVAEPGNVVLDLIHTPSVFCTILMETEDGREPTPERVKKKDDYCAGRESFSAPSGDGIPFEVIIGGVGLARDFCSGFGRKPTACGREFATYNLLTVQAENVTFTPSSGGGLLEAKGNVVVTDGRRKYRRKSVRFSVGDGRAVEVQ